jgi:hypothetical protein
LPVSPDPIGHPIYRLVSVALVLASRRTGVTRYLASGSSDFPRAGDGLRRRDTRPSDHLAGSAILPAVRRPTPSRKIRFPREEQQPPRVSLRVSRRWLASRRVRQPSGWNRLPRWSVGRGVTDSGRGCNTLRPARTGRPTQPGQAATKHAPRHSQWRERGQRRLSRGRRASRCSASPVPSRAGIRNRSLRRG